MSIDEALRDDLRRQRGLDQITSVASMDTRIRSWGASLLGYPYVAPRGEGHGSLPPHKRLMTPTGSGDGALLHNPERMTP